VESNGAQPSKAFSGLLCEDMAAEKKRDEAGYVIWHVTWEMRR
jgi:hypothetical protein